MSYTFGKWTEQRLEHKRNDEGIIKLSIIGRLDDGETFAPIGELYKHPADEDIANHIIQRYNSFDDLLEASKKALEWMSFQVYDYSPEGGQSRVIKLVEAAIAKAEGK